MRRARAVVDRVLAAALVILMSVMVANVLWQVFTRFVLQTPSSYTEELARYLLIWLSLLGGAYATGQGLHLAIDLLPGHLEGARRRHADVAIQTSVLLFALGAMVVGGARLVYLSFALEQISAALRVSLGFVYLVVPVSGLVIAFYAASALFAPPDVRPETRTAPRGAPPA